MYKRKTKDVYIILGSYLGMPEEILIPQIPSKRLGI